MSCELTDEGREIVDELVECYDETDPQLCDPVASDRGLFRVSREGSARRVFSESHGSGLTMFEGGGSCVVKIPTGAGGKVQNATEVELTDEIRGTSASRMIAPVKDHAEPRGHSDEFVDWITMRWVGGEVSNDEVREWRSEMRDKGWACSDFKKENFGENSVGEVKMIDYGDGCRQV